MRRRDRIENEMRRQRREQRRLDEQQRMIMQIGDQRLDILDEQMRAIQTNTGRIIELERLVAELDEELTKHWNDNKRHTGKLVD